MAKRVEHVDAREGYDRWSDLYDQTANPVVAMDARHSLDLLAPRRAERILDIGCGTGRHFGSLTLAGSRPVGIDVSRGMLRVARRKHPRVPLGLADLEKGLPLGRCSFDAVLCALVGEHVARLPLALREIHFVLRPGGRLLFSVYHPEMAAAGIEANFERSGIEYRLGAHRHRLADYLNALARAGFADPLVHEFRGDDDLVAAVPWAVRYLGFPILLVLQAERPH